MNPVLSILDPLIQLHRMQLQPAGGPPQKIEFQIPRTNPVAAELVEIFHVYADRKVHVETGFEIRRPQIPGAVDRILDALRRALEAEGVNLEDIWRPPALKVDPKNLLRQAIYDPKLFGHLLHGIFSTEGLKDVAPNVRTRYLNIAADAIRRGPHG